MRNQSYIFDVSMYKLQILYKHFIIYLSSLADGNFEDSFYKDSIL